MEFNLFGWAIGYSLKKLTDTCFSKKLNDNLNNTVTEWIRDLSKDYELYKESLFPGNIIEYNEENHPNRYRLSKDLSASTVPSSQTWKNALLEQWNEIKEKYNENAQSFYKEDESIIEPLLGELSDRLEKTCTKDKESFQIHVLKDLNEIKHKINTEKIMPKFISSIKLKDVKLVGRDDDLVNIRKLLVENKTPILINGIGGVGKTSIVRKYQYIYANNYDHIIWLQISSGLKDAFFNDVVLKNYLNINSSNSEEVFSYAINSLNNFKGNNLLIFDDAQEDLDYLNRYFPDSDHWDIIITSRIKFNDFNLYDLSSLNENDALILFYKHYEIEKNDEIIKKILKPVNYHTLTIELFAKTIQVYGYTLEEFKKIIDETGFNLDTDILVEHNSEQERIEHIEKYLNTVFPLEQLPSDELKILQKLALMPSMFIPEVDLLTLFNIESENKSKLILLYKKLCKKGWLVDSNKEVKLHQIIKQIVLNSFSSDFTFYKDYIEKLTELMRVNELDNDPSQKFKWASYGIELFNRIKIDNVVTIRFTNVLGILLNKLGQYDNSYAAILKANQALTLNGNYSDELKSSILNSLASVLYLKGKYRDAIDYYSQSLELYLKTTNEKDLELAAIYNNTGSAWQRLGNYDKSIECHNIALNIQIEILGKKHISVATTYGMLGNDWHHKGLLDRARKYHEKALEIKLSTFKKANLAIAITYNDLGGVFDSQKDFDNAILYHEKALKIRLDSLGEMHPDVADSYNNLGISWHKKEEFDKAIELFSHALEIDLVMLGENHPVIANLCNNLAASYGMKNDNSKALMYYNKAIQIDPKFKII